MISHEICKFHLKPHPLQKPMKSLRNINGLEALFAPKRTFHKKVEFSLIFVIFREITKISMKFIGFHEIQWDSAYFGEETPRTFKKFQFEAQNVTKF